MCIHSSKSPISRRWQSFTGFRRTNSWYLHCCPDSLADAIVNPGKTQSHPIGETPEFHLLAFAEQAPWRLRSCPDRSRCVRFPQSGQNSLRKFDRGDARISLGQPWRLLFSCPQLAATPAASTLLVPHRQELSSRCECRPESHPRTDPCSRPSASRAHRLTTRAPASGPGTGHRRSQDH
jgi:hypothetical protein